MNNNLWLFRNLLFVVKLGKSISDSLWENKKKFIFSSYFLGYSCSFWTIREYSLSYYGWIWRKAYSLLSSESFDQWVKWSYEFKYKFDKERNYEFRSVTLISLLDCRNVVVSLWLSVIIITTASPFAVMFFHKWFFYASWSSHLSKIVFLWCSNHVCCFWINWYYDNIVLNLITR